MGVPISTWEYEFTGGDRGWVLAPKSCTDNPSDPRDCPLSVAKLYSSSAAL
jgi:hypothetical protein